jgi:ketopantoate reductase
MKITILGAGAWGTALAMQATRAGGIATLWARDAARADTIVRAHANERYLPGVALPMTLGITASLEEALCDARLVLLVVPAQHLRAVVRALPAGLPRIAVTFLVDADGVLRVNAREQRTGAEASIQIVPSFGLTRDEVRKMMLDSIEHAQADYLAREAIDLRVKAEAMVRGTQKALAMAELPPDQTYAVQKATKALATGASPSRRTRTA